MNHQDKVAALVLVIVLLLYVVVVELRPSYVAYRRLTEPTACEQLRRLPSYGACDR